MTHHRTAPESWGPWAPSQARIQAAVDRALPAVMAEIARQFGPGQKLRVVVSTPAEVDLTYAPGTRHSPASTTAPAGEIHVVGKRTKWVVHWFPDRGDRGFARRVSDSRV